ncbi:Panacea domain-containing protein [Sphingomonas sp. Xoc002]|uniref:Panacea domain-containing protein n=1 Tax=Sphingomonas sp. Xoc002 TaxID=2837624 RepID=UPI003D162E3D
MAYRSLEIANEFLRQPGAQGNLTQMQLQKLAYLANGWNWAINGEQLISDPVEAWDYGPVYRELYDHTRFFGKEPLTRLITEEDSEAARVFGFRSPDAKPYHAALTEREREVIRNVWKRYGSLSGARLSALTHQRGTPWFSTYTTKGKSAVIDQNLIHSHYDHLADRVQQAAS